MKGSRPEVALGLPLAASGIDLAQDGVVGLKLRQVFFQQGPVFVSKQILLNLIELLIQVAKAGAGGIQAFTAIVKQHGQLQGNLHSQYVLACQFAIAGVEAGFRRVAQAHFEKIGALTRLIQYFLFRCHGKKLGGCYLAPCRSGDPPIEVAFPEDRITHEQRQLPDAP